MGFWDGTFTDYGTAIGTVGLALITTVFGIREAQDRRLLKAERDRERERADALEAQKAEEQERQRKVEVDRRLAEEERRRAIERRRLAEGVTCYMGPMARDPAVVVTASGGYPRAGAGPIDCATIRNTADKPVRDVEVRWQDARNPDPSGGERSIEPGGVFALLPGPGQLNVAKPESMVQWHQAQLRLLVLFTDFDGNRWARRDDGHLHSVTDGVVGPQVL